MNQRIEDLLTINIWKERRTMQDVMNSEVSNSLLFNNIHPAKLDEALQLVGLHTLPNFFFIAHVDDYSNQTYELAQVNEWRQKNDVVAILKRCVVEEGINGFCVNMSSTENVIGYVCMPEDDLEEEPQDALIRFIKVCQRKVQQKTNFTVSMYLSSQVKTMKDIQQDYEVIYRNLQKRLFNGRNQIIGIAELRNASGDTSRRVEININTWFMKICAAAGEKNSAALLAEISTDFMNEVLLANVSPERNRSGLIKLINTIEEYCLEHGVGAGAIAAETQKIIDVILKYSYIPDIRLPLQNFLCHVSQQLQKALTYRDYSFKAPVEEYIKLYYTEKIYIGDIAGLLHLSCDYFSRLFKATFGMNFHEYLLRYRVDKAAELLMEGVGVEQVAIECGFNSTSYFCTSFKKERGVTPGQFKNNRKRQ